MFQALYLHKPKLQGTGWKCDNYLENKNICQDDKGKTNTLFKRTILLMEEILHHLGCIKPCKYIIYIMGKKQPQLVNSGFLPSTV